MRSGAAASTTIRGRTIGTIISGHSAGFEDAARPEQAAWHAGNAYGQPPLFPAERFGGLASLHPRVNQRRRVSTHRSACDLHDCRVKNGIASVHPIRGDEIRALRKLRRECPKDAY